MAGKAKNLHQRRNFPGKRGSGVRDMALLLLGNLGAKLSETSFPHFKTYGVFYANLSLSSSDNSFLKKFNSNNFTLFSMFSLQNLWSRKRKAVYTLVLFRIFICFLVSHNLLIFLKLHTVKFRK